MHFPRLSHHTLTELQSIHLPFLEAASAVLEAVLHRPTVCSYLPPLLPSAGEAWEGESLCINNPLGQAGWQACCRGEEERRGGCKMERGEVLLHFHLFVSLRYSTSHLYAEPGPLCSAAWACERCQSKNRDSCCSREGEGGRCGTTHTHARWCCTGKPVLHPCQSSSKLTVHFSIQKHSWDLQNSAAMLNVSSLVLLRIFGSLQENQELSKIKKQSLTHHLVQVDTLLHWRLCRLISTTVDPFGSNGLNLSYLFCACVRAQPGRGAASCLCKRACLQIWAHPRAHFDPI